MELKPSKVDVNGGVSSGSNRTFMELKHESIAREHNANAGSNRTFMELKLPSQSAARCVCCVLIVPLWN